MKGYNRDDDNSWAWATPLAIWAAWVIFAVALSLLWRALT